MTLTIIPVAASVDSNLWAFDASLMLTPSPVGLTEGSSFLRTALPPPWSEAGDTVRHPLWIDHDSYYPQAIVDGALPEEVPSPYQGMSAEWAATVSQLVFTGLAKITDGQAVLTSPLRIRAPGVTSRTVSRLEELEWFLAVHRENERINTGVIEPVGSDDLIMPFASAPRPVPDQVNPAFVKPWPKAPEPPQTVAKPVIVAPRKLPDPIPAYMRSWFESRGRLPNTLQDAFEEALKLTKEEIEDLRRHLERMPVVCETALEAFRKKLNNLGESSGQNLAIQNFLNRLLLIDRAHLLAEAALEGIELGHKPGPDLNAFVRAKDLI